MENKHRVLEAEDIHASYGTSHVIQGLSLYVKEGECVSILGRNGVGKTTTLRCIMGLLSPWSGHIRILGRDTVGWPPHQVSRMGAAYVPSERWIFPGLSVQENLKLGSQRRRGDEGNFWTVERVYEQFPVLRERAKQDGSTLSGGEQQMLAIARGLMSNPRVMLLDEPSQGLSPLLAREIADIILSCSEQGITILLVEQNYKIALNVASRHYLMGNKGMISRVSSSEELIDSPDIIVQHLAV